MKDLHPNEMGDIGPALDLLLSAQAGYARGDARYSRGMCDVAKQALIRAINDYLRWHATSPIGRPMTPQERDALSVADRAELPGMVGAATIASPIIPGQIGGALLKRYEAAFGDSHPERPVASAKLPNQPVKITR